jgi:hypothetical protein
VAPLYAAYRPRCCSSCCSPPSPSATSGQGDRSELPQDQPDQLMVELELWPVPRGRHAARGGVYASPPRLRDAPPAPGEHAWRS